MAADQALTLTLQLDTRAVQAAVSALGDLAKTRAEVVQEFLRTEDSLFDLRQIHADGLSACAGEVRLRLEPTDRLLRFLAACRAGNVDGV